jgi:hypothetical protein
MDGSVVVTRLFTASIPDKQLSGGQAGQQDRGDLEWSGATTKHNRTPPHKFECNLALPRMTE